MASKIFGQLPVGGTVAYHIAACQVIAVVVDVFLQHSDAGFAVGMVVFRKMAVYVNGIESDAFSGQCLKHKIVHGPESIFRKRVCAETILIGNHDKFEIEFSSYQSKTTKNPWHKAQFLKTVYLLIVGLLYQGAVTVYE